MGKTFARPLVEVIIRIISRKPKKIWMNDDKISDRDNQDFAYFHTTAIKIDGGKESGRLAHCITIAPTGKVEPGRVVQYKKLPLE